MNFIDAAALARGVGNAIRCAGWVDGVAIRWSWDRMRWEGTSDHRDKAAGWIDTPNHPSPNDIQRKDWEVVGIA